MITIVTPSYNRAYILPRLYESLLKQQEMFEWVLIDDGSTDATEIFAQSVIDDGKILFQYIKQVNQGKHIALNTGVNYAKGEWIFIVDSDDFLIDSALTQLTQDINKYGDQYELCYRRKLIEGKVVGNTLDNDTLVLSATEAGKVFNGDLAYVFKTKTMKNFPFPQISHEKFVPELYIWNKISDQYKILFFAQKSIYVCEYLEDGYSQRFKEHLKKNPMGFLLFYRNQISREKNIVCKIKYLVRCVQCVWYMK